jgi:Raf kinase inhibitor-like YbhB/YbcL family protein
MRLWSDGFEDGDPIPVQYAFGKYHPEQRVELSDNMNPHLAWEGAPEGTRSYALICHDRDVPSRADDVNQEGKTVPADLPRVEFFHLVLVDIPAETSSFAEGELSRGVTPRGKSGPDAPGGMRHGANNYTEWFAGDADMEGTYFGYDGPCPPWNDSIVHHYHFTLYALDVERCPAEGQLRGPEVREAIAGHILAQAELSGTFAINPAAENRG